MNDLHIHSIYSDGLDNVNQIVLKSKLNNVNTISITDHNSIKSASEIQKYQINSFSGVEFYAQKEGIHGLHILGYDYDCNNIKLIKQIARFDLQRINCFLEKIQILRDTFHIIFEDYEIKKAIDSSFFISDKELYNMLCLKNIETNVISDIMRYFKSIGVKVDKKLYYEEVIKLIHDANGISVLAHPNSLNLNDDDFNLLIEELIRHGLNGIEVYSSKHSIEEIQYYLTIANKYNLLISGGSDYHGNEHTKYTYLNNRKIGAINNGGYVNDLSLVNYIKKRGGGHFACTK